DDVFKALEVARNEKVIGKSLEAKVYVTSPEGLDFTDINGSLEQLFIVSQVEVADALPDGIEYDNVTVKVEHADRKSTRLNSSHVSISYAVFCLKKKTTYAML